MGGHWFGPLVFLAASASIITGSEGHAGRIAPFPIPPRSNNTD